MPDESPHIHFAFPGRLEAVLRRYLSEDAGNWRLSRKFVCYYQLRRWIPLRLRQLLQERRNSSMQVEPGWFCHSRFLKDFNDALTAELAECPNQTLLHPWPDGYSHAAILSHDIETREGVKLVQRLANLEEEFGFRSAWYFVPAKYRIDAGLLADLQQRGHEIGMHGYNHDGKLFFSRKTFEQRARFINQKVAQWNSQGFRSPMMHRELDWMQSLDINYDSSCFDIDPFQAMPGGVGGIWPFLYGKFVELPCTLPQDHTLFITLREQSIDIWRRKLELIRKLRGMALTIVHPDYLDTPQRWDLYRELLVQWRDSTTAWNCLPQQAAQWWRERHHSEVKDQQVVGPAAKRARVVKLANLFEGASGV